MVKVFRALPAEIVMRGGEQGDEASDLSAQLASIVTIIIVTRSFKQRLAFQPRKPGAGVDAV